MVKDVNATGDAQVTHDEKHALADADMAPELAAASGRRKSNAVNIVTNPLKVNSAPSSVMYYACLPTNIAASATPQSKTSSMPRSGPMPRACQSTPSFSAALRS
jgi:hypothetical protein